MRGNSHRVPVKLPLLDCECIYKIVFYPAANQQLIVFDEVRCEQLLFYCGLEYQVIHKLYRLTKAPSSRTMFLYLPGIVVVNPSLKVRLVLLIYNSTRPPLMEYAREFARGGKDILRFHDTLEHHQQLGKCVVINSFRVSPFIYRKLGDVRNRA